MPYEHRLEAHLPPSARAQYSFDNLRSTDYLRRLTIVSVTAMALLQSPCLQLERGFDALVIPDMVTLCAVHPTDTCEHLSNQS